VGDKARRRRTSVEPHIAVLLTTHTPIPYDPKRRQPVERESESESGSPALKERKAYGELSLNARSPNSVLLDTPAHAWIMCSARFYNP